MVSEMSNMSARAHSNTQQSSFFAPTNSEAAEFRSNLRDMASKMGGQDNYTGVGKNFNKSSLDSDNRAQGSFIEKLETELGYQNLT